MEPTPVTYSRRDILTPKVPPGGLLRVQITAEIQKKCIATVYRSIVDSSGAQTNFEPVTRPAFTNYIAEISVPLGSASGLAHYVAKVEWVCNPLQRWFPNTIYQPELDFTIEPSEGQLSIPQQQGIYSLPLDKSDYAQVPP